MKHSIDIIFAERMARAQAKGMRLPTRYSATLFRLTS